MNLERLLTEPQKVIDSIKKQTEDYVLIEQYKKEYYKHDREIRDSQVGKIQTDKVTPTKVIKSVRIPINFAKKIVTTSTVFEVGKPVTLIPSEENDLSNMLFNVWKINRTDSLIQKLVALKKSETQAAIQFYISDIKENSNTSKVLDQQKQIKVNLLENSNGIMTKYLDSAGDMVLFMWEYKSTNEKGKVISNVEIWDKLNRHYLNDESGKLFYSLNGIIPHGFDVIPIVYVSQEEPEWFVVREIIDRYEVSLSKLGASNDYSAYPLLQIFGKIESLPNKDEGGKILQFPIKVDENGKEHHGKAEFLESKNSVDSSKLEFDILKELIYSISQTPDLSFNNIKGIGSISGVALKLMFLDAVIKATLNEGENRTMVERIIKVYLSGITNTTNTNLQKEYKNLYFDVSFNSIIPSDVETAANTIISLKEAGLLSTDTAIKLLDIVEDSKKESENIKTENDEKTNTVVI